MNDEVQEGEDHQVMDIFGDNNNNNNNNVRDIDSIQACEMDS